MYNKMISNKWENREQVVLDVIGNQLQFLVGLLIFRIYKNRAVDNPKFDYDKFILDLQGYLKFSSDKGVSRQDLRFLQEQIVSELQSRYDSNVRYKNFSRTKKAYFLTKDKEVVRFYHDRPAEFFYQKLAGFSFADLAKVNNLLMASAIDVAGEPLDLVERFLPLDEVLGKLTDQAIIEQIKVARDSNPVAVDFSVAEDTNLALVVRHQDGFKKVYVVAFDLAIKFDFGQEQNFLYDFKKKYANVQPQALSYEQLVRFLPELEDL